MFASAIHQLRYAFGLMRGERMPVGSLSRLARDLVATLAETGESGEAHQLLGQNGPQDPEVRRTITSRRLRKTAQRAARWTAYYRELFGSGRLDPDDLTLDNWSELPVTPKAALRGMPDAFTAANVEPAVLAQTTGTTGHPTSVWFSRREIEMIIALNTISGVLAHGLRPGKVLAFAGSSRATLAVLGVGASVPATGAAFVQLGTIDPEVALERLAAPLAVAGGRRQITHLASTPSYLSALVSAAQRGGWRSNDFGLESIQVGGEILSTSLRTRAAEVFGAEIATSYILTEAVPAGGTLCRTGHLHFGAEFAHFEVLDPATYRPTLPGELGTIVVTPFVPYRECTLLLRYVTGDIVRVPAQPPACELASVPATSDILGRFAGPASLRVLQRDILELLESLPEVTLPARYALVDGAHGPVLHVLVDRPTASLLSRLEGLVADRNVDIARLVLHADPTELPLSVPVRADLREETFDRRVTAQLVGSHA